MTLSLAALAAPTRVVSQVLPSGEEAAPTVIQWRVSVLTPSEMLEMSALATAFEGGLVTLHQKAKGLRDDGDGSPDVAVQQQFFKMLGEITCKVVTAVSVDGGQTWEPVVIVPSRQEEDASQGRIFVGTLELGTSPDGDSVLGAVFQASFGALLEAQKKVGNFRQQPSR